MMEKIAVDWIKSVVVGTGASPAPRFQMRATDRQRVQDEQRRRARELLAAMGIKAAATDRQIARMLEVLGPHIPGLQLSSPIESEPVPSAFGVTWTATAGGRPVEWPPERLRDLLAQVDAMKAAGRASSDQAALRLVRSEAKANGLHGLPKVGALADRLKQARDLPG